MISIAYDKDQKTFDSFLNLQMIYNLLFCGIQLELPTGKIYIIYAIINCLIFFKLIAYIKVDFTRYSLFSRLILFIYFLYALKIITDFNGHYSIRSILRYASVPSGFLYILTPIIVSRFSTINFLPVLYRHIYRQSIIFFIIFILFFVFDVFLGTSDERRINHLECLQLYIGGGTIFLLLFQNYFNRKEKNIIWFIVFFILISAAVLARRTIVATYLIGIGLYCIFMVLSIRNILKKLILLICLSILFGGITYIVISYADQIFPQLIDRLDDDTRTGVELEVIYELEKSDKKLTGLGINSYYYSEYVDEVRDGCETGYLNMMMKGGVIYVCIFYMLCIPAIIKMIFKTGIKKDYILYLFYSILILIVGNAASSTFTFSIRYITFIIIILSMYKKNKCNKYEV